MSIDDGLQGSRERPDNTPAKAPQSSRERPNTSPNEQSGGNSNPHQPQANSTRIEVNESEVEKILASLDAASENNLNTQATPQNKYTEGPMPTIHDDSPAALLDGINKEQARKWLMIPTGKVLARPFDVMVHYQPNHKDIGLELIRAANDITGSKVATVASPFRDRKSGGKPTITFLIHNLTQSEVNILLGQSVWSSEAITFQVSPITTPRPDFLFTLTNFTTFNEADVHNALLEVWKDRTTTTFFDELVLRAPDDKKQAVTNGILDFIKSTEIQRLDIKKEKGKLDPHFNVYARGQFLTSDALWYEIKAFLKGRSYKSSECGKGKVKTENFYCRLCHGCDHPRGLCPFPKLPGWNGGGYRATRPDESEITSVAEEGRPQKRPYSSPQGSRYPAPTPGPHYNNYGRKRQPTM